MILQRADANIPFKKGDIVYYYAGANEEYIKVRIAKILPDNQFYDYEVDPLHSPFSGASRHSDLYIPSTIYDDVDDLSTM